MLQKWPETGATEVAHSSGSQDWQKKHHFSEAELNEMVLAAYEQAIELAPHEAILYYHKGQALEHLGRISEAQQAYTEARQLGHGC